MVNKNLNILHIAIVLFFFILFFSFISGHLLSVDEMLMLETSKSILGQHSLALPASMNEVTNAVIGIDGVYYSKYPLGMSFLAIPFLLIGKLLSIFLPFVNQVTIDFVCLLLNPLITAISCLLIFLICTRFNIKPKTAFFTSLCFGICTPAWHYAKGFTSGPVVVVCLLFMLFLLMDFADSQQNKKANLILAGLFAGFMIFSRYAAIIFLPIFAVYVIIISKKDKIKNVFMYILPIVFFSVLIAIFNYMRFGDIMKTGYEQSGIDRFNIPLITGLKLYMFSPQRSLFLYMPVSIVSALGFLFLFKSYKKESFLILSLILVNIFLYSKWHSDGGWCWGPRFLLPSIALLMLPLGFFIERVKKQKMWVLFLMLPIFLLSFIINFLGVVINPNQYYDLKTKIAQEESAQLPNQIITSSIFLKHKLQGKEEIYNLSDFNIKSDKQVDFSQQLQFRSLSLWFMLLKAIKGLNVGVYIIMFLSLLNCGIFLFILKRVSVSYE